METFIAAFILNNLGRQQGQLGTTFNYSTEIVTRRNFGDTFHGAKIGIFRLGKTRCFF